MKKRMPHVSDGRKVRADTPLKLWATADIAWFYGVSRPTVRKWVERYDDFPEPVAIIRGYMKVYDTEQIQRWFAKRVAIGRASFATPSPQRLP